MPSGGKFGLLRNLLRAIGLSQESVDDVVNFIADLLTGEDKGDRQDALSPEYPYLLRDHFLPPAELSFYSVLRSAVSGRTTLNTKVALEDLFYVRKGDDASRWRIYTNKIDRKHVDFLLCDPATMQPLVGIELDDSSYQREDRRERDAFVDEVFAAAELPLLHVAAKRAYVVDEIARQLAPYLGTPVPTTPDIPAPRTEMRCRTPSPAQAETTPRCPKCGSDMILRTAKSGANASNRFWGCSTFPTCRGMLPYPDSGSSAAHDRL
ncbi:MAG: DUF2726 domain-containing protein [Anaerolineae bacterium]|nr:DUF2726 domain-containing protein [Anaerolineae bacterium]